MTQRERHTAEGGAFQAPPPAGSPASPVPSAPAAKLDVGSLWEEWYGQASPAKRQELLTIAARQGILYAHQLSAAENGKSAASRRPILTALLNGQTRDLVPLDPPALTFHDGELDSVQRDAVARALATPDVFLIQGFPGTGKSRVVAEILAQSVERGERVLLLAPCSAAIDRALELLGPRDSVCPLRCETPGEAPDALPPCIRRLTLAGRTRTFKEQTLPAARESILAAERRMERRRREETLWPRLEQHLARFTPLIQREHELSKRLAAVSEDVTREFSVTNSPAVPSLTQSRVVDLRGTRDEAQAQLDGRLAVARAEMAKVRGEKTQVSSEKDWVAPLVEARRGGRVFAMSYWKAMVRGVTPARLEELNQRELELAAAEQRLGTEIAELETDHSRAEDQYRDCVARLTAEETERRRTVLQQQMAELLREQTALRQDWQAVRQQFSEGNKAPTGIDADSLRQARQDWDRQLRHDTLALDFALQWAASLEESLPTLEDRLTGCANVVAATTTALAGDPHFGDQASVPACFDLLILEEAHDVTEAEFLHLARRARRWVLVGEPQVHVEPSSAAPRKSRHPKALASASLRPGFFQGLWKGLHDDPRRLPQSWFHRQGRLVCRLRPVRTGEERHLHSEWVADRPEIELRILVDAASPPELAEVVFPGFWTPQQAKDYIYHELEEVRVHSHGHAIRWFEEANRVVLHLADASGTEVCPVALEPGVSEWVGPLSLSEREMAEGWVPWHTCRIEFDRAAGWPRARAEQWAEDHLQIRPTGRTVLFGIPHRMEPALGDLVSLLLADDLLDRGRAMHGTANHVNGDSARENAPVQFIAVPSHSDHQEGRRGGLTAARSVSGKGAGLETDLAEPRRPDQMPGELRSCLPREGLVNYLEARAVVRALQDLTDDPAFLAAASDWHRRRAVTCDCAALSGPQWFSDGPAPRVGHCPTIAVIALYPAQVELLCRLMEDAGVRAPGPFRVEVGLPSDFRQRECLVALVSLTRSHTHRAVPFGESPRDLALAFTRAAGRLWIFGDPGTLARRGQWSGPLDHLDGDAAERERGLIARLYRFIQGQDVIPAGTRHLQGSGV